LYRCGIVGPAGGDRDQGNTLGFLAEKTVGDKEALMAIYAIFREFQRTPKTAEPC
jgi:hypothetical protein